jgi:CheY-like chemotaxis protein
VGTGARFTVTLPVAAVPLDEPKTEVQAEAGGEGAAGGVADLPSLEGIRVLVVDDEPDAREVIRRTLEDRGATVVTAGSAAEALERLSSERPGVLLSDIAMPGTDGYGLLKRVRALGPDRHGDVPAIALTAFAGADDRAKVLRAGYLTHVAKPVEPRELVAAVARAVVRPGEAGGE